MSVLSRHLDTGWADAHWPADTQALLNESHAAAWTVDGRAASRFVSSLQRFLAMQPDTEVWLLGGSGARSLDVLAQQVELQSSMGRVAPRIDGPGGLTSAFRHHGSDVYGVVSRFRYIIWHGVDDLIATDRGLFGDVADAMLGTAAEAEFGADELMLIQRCVFVGGQHIRRYGDDPKGQLRRWRRDGAGRPFWEVVSGVERPPVKAYAVERLMQGGVYDLDIAL